MSENQELDLIWGVEAIGNLIGRTDRQTYHMIQTGSLPMVKQVGQRYVASRAKLITFFMEDAACPPSRNKKGPAEAATSPSHVTSNSR